LLFDLLDRITPSDAFAAPPGTSLTPLDTADGHSQDGQVLVSQGLWAAFPPGPGPKPVHAALAAAAADQIGQPETPTFELTTDGALLDAQPSADDELASIVSPLRELVRLPLPDEPPAEDHVCTPADFVVGPVARFEANLAALPLVKTLVAEGRPATPDERAVLARFSGCGRTASGGRVAERAVGAQPRRRRRHTHPRREPKGDRRRRHPRQE
jgi:hypothetical protein